MTEPKPADRKTTVLIVDDDPAFVQLAQHHLDAAGYTTISARDSIQGLVVAKKEHPAVVLVDLQMPAGGGLQLLERLRANRATETIPLVMVTASRDAGLEEQARARGAVGFLHKPVDREALLATVEGALPLPPSMEFA